jgi:hypothetical protein
MTSEPYNKELKTPGKPGSLPRRPRMPGTTSAQYADPVAAGDRKSEEARSPKMMIGPQIVCPKCSTEIKLTESLAEPLVAEARRHFEQQLARKEAEFGEREAQLRDAQDELVKATEDLDEKVTAKLALERSRLTEAEARRARAAVAAEMASRDRQMSELEEALIDRGRKLAEAQRVQADVMRKERDLDDAKRELDLTIEKQVQEALVGVRNKARAEADDALKAKISEKEAQITGMQRQIEELRRRADQGSQQLQGEAQEIELESLLRTGLSRDLIEPVAKGEFGGDVLHRVLGPGGQVCGTILWESKRTKNWSDTWLGKLRDDQRAAKADVALIVSSTLPKTIETFGLIENVWVADPRFALPLTIALRQSLIDLAAVRVAHDGQQGKMELVYAYLTGPRFRHRVEAIMEKFTDMQTDLDRERKTMMRLWAKREEQLRGVLESTAGLYGDLQGIAGRAMPEIDSLDLLLIEAKTDAAE